MSTITEIGTVIVPASDQDEALELYVGTLGFEVRIDGVYGNGERWLDVAPPGAVTTIALVPSDAANGIEVSFTTRAARPTTRRCGPRRSTRTRRSCTWATTCRRCSPSVTPTETASGWCSGIDAADSRRGASRRGGASSRV